MKKKDSILQIKKSIYVSKSLFPVYLKLIMQTYMVRLKTNNNFRKKQGEEGSSH